MAEYKSYADDVKRKLNKSVGLILIGIGEIVATRAKLNVPVDTGRLRGSIDYETSIVNKQTIISASTEYAVSVELGTSRQRSQPYLEPAAKNSVHDMQTLAGKILSNNMK